MSVYKFTDPWKYARAEHARERRESTQYKLGKWHNPPVEADDDTHIQMSAKALRKSKHQRDFKTFEGSVKKVSLVVT